MFKNFGFLIFGVFFLLLFENCREKPNSIVILDPTQSEKLNLGSPFQLIQLETIKESNLEFISKTAIDFQNNKVFVLADFNIFIFDLNGKFISKIKKGRGPNEISQIVSFSINKKSRLIYALDKSTRICVINYDGAILNDYQLENIYSLEIKVLDDNNVFLLDNFVTEKDSNFIILYNLAENRIRQKFIPIEDSPYSILVMVMGNNFTSLGNRQFFACSNIFGLYEYKENQFQKILTFDLRNRAVPNSFSKKFLEGTRRIIFRDEAQKNNYVPFLLNAFYFKNYYIAIIDDELRSCYAIDENSQQKVFLNGPLSAYFNLPNVKSLRNPKEIEEEYLVFSCNPLDFFENDPIERTKQIEIGEHKIEINYDSNPFLIIVE